MPSNLVAMVSDLETMASNLLAMASDLETMASNLLAMASNLVFAKLCPQPSGAIATCCSHISACSQAAPPNSAAELRQRLRHEASMMLI